MGAVAVANQRVEVVSKRQTYRKQFMEATWQAEK